MRDPTHGIWWIQIFKGKWMEIAFFFFFFHDRRMSLSQCQMKNKYAQICSKDLSVALKLLVAKGWISDSERKQPEKQNITKVIESMWSQVLCTDLIKISTFKWFCQAVFLNLRQNRLASPHLETQALIFMVKRESLCSELCYFKWLFH